LIEAPICSTNIGNPDDIAENPAPTICKPAPNTINAAPNAKNPIIPAPNIIAPGPVNNAPNPNTAAVNANNAIPDAINPSELTLPIIFNAKANGTNAAPKIAIATAPFIISPCILLKRNAIPAKPANATNPLHN